MDQALEILQPIFGTELNSKIAPLQELYILHAVSKAGSAAPSLTSLFGL